MKIENLALQAFRNYDKAQLNFTTNIILVVGDNAQGKTNLIESIYTLAFSKSYRTNITKELIKDAAEFSKINATIHFDNAQHKKVEYILTKKKKRIKVNNVEQKQKSSFVGLIKVIKFSPEDLNLVKGNPSIRRKFIDMYLSQLDKEYLLTLVKYNHLLKQKNALLKTKTVDKTLVRIYNQRLAEFIEILVKKRSDFIEKYQGLVQGTFLNIVEHKESFKLEYSSLFFEKSLAEINAILEEQLDREINYCGSLVGIQKDDLTFFINDKNAKQFGSQGQQRTIVLSLIISLVEYIYQEIGEYPILILDDVMSELDEHRKLQLLHAFKENMQIFLTTTSVEDIAEKIDLPYELYHVEAGHIEKIKGGEA